MLIIIIIIIIDHVFVSNDLISRMTDYKAVVDATNLSDHLPIQFCLATRSHFLPNCITDVERVDEFRLLGVLVTSCFFY